MSHTRNEGVRRNRTKTRPMMQVAPTPRTVFGDRSAGGGPVDHPDDADNELASVGLIVEEPGRPPTMTALADGTTVVGCAGGCDLRLRGRYVSRRHCALTLREGELSVEDLHSRNGTEVDGRQVSRASLAPDTLLHVGDVSCSVVACRPGWANGVAFDGASDAGGGVVRFARMVGADPQTLARFHLINKVAASSAAVLLQGPSGVGKELAAQAIHARSSRRGGPLVVVNCAALPVALAEAELFGSRRGAYTGAARDREGAFVSADGGKLFLDEIAVLAGELQPKLLRALESGEVRALGSDRCHRVDVRFVAATNRSLFHEAAEGRFRSDLLYRLAGVTIDIPALSRRPADIPALTDAILCQLSQGRRALDANAMSWLGRQDWPGNVRQLRNHVQAALTLSRHPVLGVADLERARRPAGNAARTAPDTVGTGSFVDRAIVTALVEQSGSRSAAIRELGIPRSTFYARLRRLRDAGHLPSNL